MFTELGYVNGGLKSYNHTRHSARKRRDSDIIQTGISLPLIGVPVES